MVATALPLLAASSSQDPLAVAAVIAAQHAPWIVVALAWQLIAGADRRTVVGLIDTVRALAVGYLGVVSLAGSETILKIQLVALVIGLGEALTGSVEEESDDSRLSMRGMFGLAAVGMPLGGFLYEIFIAVPFLMDVLFFALAALFALFIRRPVAAPASTAPVPRPQLAPGTVPVALTGLIASVARSAVLGILVLFALHDLGLGAPAWGLLLAGLAAATATGAWVAPEVGSALGLRVGFAVAAVVASAALFTASRIADETSPLAAAAALGIGWATATTGGVLLRALLPAAAGRPVTGGALRAFHLVEWTGVCVGALAGGWLARRVGVGDVLAWAAAVWLLAGTSVLAVRRRAVDTAAETPAGKWLDAA